MKTEQRSPWREPMVWLVAAIPALSFIAVGGLFWAASQAGGVDRVADRVERTGQIQVANTGPVEQAMQRGLKALIKWDGKRLEVYPASGTFDRSQNLILKLHHPVTADEDRSVSLIGTVHGWAAEFALPTGHDWLLELEPQDGSWRLEGRWPAGQQAALLAPSLAVAH